MLTKQIDLKIESSPCIIYLCFVLHNFCEISNIEINAMLTLKQMRQGHNNDQVLKTTKTISVHVILRKVNLFEM